MKRKVMKFVMETNNLVIRNNLILKFNKDHEYPLVHYRDEYNCMIHDNDSLFVFLTDTFANKDIDIETLDWDRVVNIEKNIYNFSNAYEYLYTNIKDLNIRNANYLEPRNIDMEFLIKYKKSIFIVTIYFFKIQKNDLFRLENMPLEYRGKFYNFGNELINKLSSSYTEKAVDEMYRKNPSSIIKNEEKEVSFFTKIKECFFSTKKVILKEDEPEEIDIISTKEFLSCTNFTEIIPDLMDEYIYERTTPDKKFKDFLNNLMLVFSVNQKEEI